MILLDKRITKALISLRGCAGWSAPMVFVNPRRQVFSRRGPCVGGFSLEWGLGRVGIAMRFYVREHPKAQPAIMALVYNVFDHNHIKIVRWKVVYLLKWVGELCMQPIQYNKDDNFVIDGRFWWSGLKWHCKYNRCTHEMYQCHYLIIILS